MATQPPLKSILKKPTSSSTQEPAKQTKTAKVRAPPQQSKSKKSPDTSNVVSISQDDLLGGERRKRTPEEAREIALYHANLIQRQKNFELDILGSLEALLDLPTTQQRASDPAEVDIVEFKKNLAYFRPSDYDDLIEERNIILKCGYALCPLNNKKPRVQSKFRVLDGARKIVESKLLERFCDDECARRGLWIRVQLSEEPAWLRLGTEGVVGENVEGNVIKLLEEERKDNRGDHKALRNDLSRLAGQLDKMGIKGTGFREAGKAEAAGGDFRSSTPTTTTTITPTQKSSPAYTGAVELVNIRERPPKPVSADKQPEPPMLPFTDDGEVDVAAVMAALAIDGYVPKRDAKASKKVSEVEVNKEKGADVVKEEVGDKKDRED